MDIAHGSPELDLPTGLNQDWLFMGPDAKVIGGVTIPELVEQASVLVPPSPILSAVGILMLDVDWWARKPDATPPGLE